MCSSMADPADAATAPANDDDVDDLYADLDDQVTAALAAAGESGGSNAKDSDPATDAEAEADAIEAVDLGDGLAGYSSSDEESEDDLHIVLNEDGCAPPPPSASRCEEGWAEESEEGELRASLLKSLSAKDGGQRKLHGLHYKGPLDKTTVAITGQGDLGHQHAFQKDYYFFLPRNRTVFDINIEAFQQKPWRQHGIDLTDYFNFGLDEEGWRKYCFGMKQFTQGARSLAEKSSGMDQESHHNLESSKLMPKSAIYSGFEGSNDVAKPKGRAIDVQGGLFERLPSADMWRPRERDSDVVIQVNMMLSPSHHSTSDDNSTVNDKCMTTERVLVNDPGVKCLKDTNHLVDKVVHKEVLNGGSSECTGSKLDTRDSASTRDHFSSPRYSDMLSEESTEDCYFKRANRYPNSKATCSDTKLKNVYAKSDFCRHSSKSDQESAKGDSHSYTPSPADDRYDKTDEPDFMSSGVFMNRQSDHHLFKYGHQERKEQMRKGSAHVRHDVFEKEEKIAYSYASRYDRKHEEKRSSSTFLGNDCRNAVHNQVYERRDYSPAERAALRNGVHRFSTISNHHHDRFSWHEFNDGQDDLQRLSLAKGWQRRHDHGYGYKSVQKAELSDDIDRHMYRESYYQETRRVRHGHGEDDELFDYNDYRFGEFCGPEVRRKYRSRRSAESSDEHWRHPYHLVSPPRANDYPKNPERNWSSPGLTSLSSRNSRNAKFMQYHHDEYYQNNKHHNSSVHVDNIQQSVTFTAAPSETGYCILPVKRKLHAGLGSMSRKDLLGIAISKGRRLKHDQFMISDRKLYAVEMHNSPKETVREAIYSFSDMRNSNTISNIHDERRHEHMNIQPKDADSIRLNDRKRKFKLQGNEIRRVESDNEGGLPADKNLHSSKHKDVHQKAQKMKLNRSYYQSVYQGLVNTANQRRQTTKEEDEIEEGELIEEDHQDTAPNRRPNKPRNAALESVIEASSGGQLEMINATSKDICDKGATRECDEKHILKVMEKMQKRRERFKEDVTVTQKEQDNGKDELLAVACGADDVKNQRPARKRRWGGNG
ncbi:hypothetical protein CFC21_057801 [Triticum aestivum]|uniref:Pre-mRNA polyadenylation factor Fip1 domain-containing protein n=3 Tax=Triticum TaxID=4564 RepID=A0A9R0T8E7_TRITD|nr:FIP1[III]-like protein isoform X1 [Triticum dicoccoides]XP_044370019.1 FIP1[III]-like protein isoform X1 [Triticum aestivum]KAF7049232.1 hypothetical protein CFC21_057801 [Triticum aestivum]VAI06406.1 unnamed protein product [Triticum turgidum subsp. durum]